jgi:hypothetical protein
MEFQSVIRRSRQVKIQALANRLAVEMAKSKSDPAYNKYKMFRDKFIDAKKSLGRRYKTAAMRQARLAMRAKISTQGGNNESNGRRT